MLNKKYYYPVVTLLFAYIILFSTLGLYNYPMPGDDFDFAMNVAKNGFWKAQYLMYTGWSGRIINTFLVDLFASLPLETIYPFLATITTLTYITSIYVLVKTIKPDISLREGILLSLIGTASTLAFTYSLRETFYWLAGSPYFWCTSLMLLTLAFAIKSLRGERIYFYLCVVFILINGTNLEQPAIFQGIIAFIAMIYYLYMKDRRRAAITCVFWLVSILAFLVIFLAPGTSARMSSVEGAQSIVSRTIRGVAIAGVHGFFTAIKFFVKPIIYAFLFFLPLFNGKISSFNKNINLKAWHIVIITSLIAPTMQFLQSWSMGTGFPDRAVSLTLWSMGFVWCVLWTFCYSGRITQSPSFIACSNKYRWLALCAALLVSSNFLDVVSALKTAPAYKAEQEARREYILSQRDSGVLDIIVPKLKNKPALIYSDMGIIVTGDQAEYYGVKSIMALPEAMIGDKNAIEELREDSLVPLVKYAEEGDAELQYLLGWHSDPIYKSPQGLNMSLDEAEKWDLMGAKNGHAKCMRALSRVIYSKDKSINGILRAMYWLTRYQLATIRL